MKECIIISLLSRLRETAAMQLTVKKNQGNVRFFYIMFSGGSAPPQRFPELLLIIKEEGSDQEGMLAGRGKNGSEAMLKHSKLKFTHALVPQEIPLASVM